MTDLAGFGLRQLALKIYLVTSKLVKVSRAKRNPKPLAPRDYLGEEVRRTLRILSGDIAGCSFVQRIGYKLLQLVFSTDVLKRPTVQAWLRDAQVRKRFRGFGLYALHRS